MGTKEILSYTEEDFVAVLKSGGRTPKSAEEDVQAIENWIKTQPHLPEVPDKEVILRFLCINKFSIETTKEKIDNYYSIRNFATELYSHHPLSSEMLAAYRVWHYVTLPKLVKLSRVAVFKMIDGNPENFNPGLFYSHIINFTEVRIVNECCINDIVVMDISNVKITHMLKAPIVLTQKIQTVFEKVYTTRVKELHIIHGFEALMNFIKSTLKLKLRDRIFVHGCYDSLYKHIPKEVLPKDLGGEEKTLKELSEIQLKCFEEMKEKFDVLTTIKSNEKLRPGKAVNDDFFGFYGNFKKIEVD